MLRQFSPVRKPADPLSDSEDADDERNKEHEATLRLIREFNLKPREIRDYLDRFVIQQSEAKKVLSVAICDHYNHVRQCLENPGVARARLCKAEHPLIGPDGRWENVSNAMHRKTYRRAVREGRCHKVLGNGLRGR